MQRRSYDFQSSELFDFLFVIALHSYLIKQEKGMNKEFSHRYSRGGAVLSAFFVGCARGRVVLCENFLVLRTHKQVIMIAVFVFLCSLLQIDL